MNISLKMNTSFKLNASLKINASLKWITSMVPGLSVTPREYMDRMTLAGTKVEGYHALGQDLDKIVVGQIISIERHPDAEKLAVCQVDVAQEEPVQIVTGAPNIARGQKIPVVLAGGRVAGTHDKGKTAGGIKIHKGIIRGVASDGMMCSIEELGSSREMYPEAPEEGVYIFDEDALVGEDAVKALGLDDVSVEHDIALNRADCFGVIGIAREAAAAFGKPFCPPIVTPTGNREDVNQYIKAEVEAVDLCPRYTVRVVKNIQLKPSPKWMQRRLAAHGIRPVNNIVDITNYVMEEFGQPMHAYDLDMIAGRRIIVRRAVKEERFVTLDGREWILDDSAAVVCDADKVMGIGGIAGGRNSMITDQAATVLFEAACFNGTNIRGPGKKGLRTRASSRFAKGLDPDNTIEAVNRACQLVEELGAGEVVSGAVDVYTNRKAGRRIPFELEKYNRLLGTDITPEEMLGYFEKLAFGYDEKAKEMIIPSWRQDILCGADLAEEAARFYGYDKMAATLPRGDMPGKLSLKLRIEALAEDVAECCGFSQGMAYAFESPEVFDKLLLAKDSELRNAAVISGPPGEDRGIMRTTPLNGMLSSLALNYNRHNKNVRLYELGNVYLPDKLHPEGLPEERMQFTLGMYGEGDFFTLKGVMEEFLSRVGMRKKPRYDPDAGKAFLHPGRQADVIYDGSVIGCLGEVHPAAAANYTLKERVYVAVIDMPEIVKRADFGRKYKALARYPAVTRDISMVCPKQVLAGEIEDVIEKQAGEHLESYHLFDIYEGSQIKLGYKSMAYSITFCAPERTLDDETVNASMERIIKSLEAMDIELRK